MLLEIARGAHSAQMAQIVLFMQRQSKAALTVVHRDVIKVVRDAFATAIYDYKTNISELTLSLHRRMQSRDAFNEAFLVRNLNHCHRV